MSEKPPKRDSSPTEYKLSAMRCPSCGELLGEPPADICPSCGQAISAASVSGPSALLPEATHGPVPTEYDPGGPIPPEWDLKCIKCGYSLTGLISRVCPECGLAFKPRRTWEANRRPKRWFQSNVSEAPPEPGPVRSSRPTVYDPGGPIPAEWDLHCSKCGYNLTGLTSRVCPECGLAFKPRETWETVRYGKRRILPEVLPAVPTTDEETRLAGQFRFSAPTVVDLGEEIPAEWDLRCTKCRYSLTGLTTRLCPECGQPFKPRQTWEANRRPKRWGLPIEKGELVGILVGAAGGALLCWGGFPFNLLVPMTWVLVCIWLFLELHAWAMGRDVSYIRMFFVGFVTVVLLKWLL